MPCRYIARCFRFVDDGNDAVNVVWHNYEGAQFNIREMFGNSDPSLRDHCSHLSQGDFSIINLPK